MHGFMHLLSSCNIKISCASVQDSRSCSESVFSIETRSLAFLTDSSCAGGEYWPVQNVTRICLHIIYVLPRHLILVRRLQRPPAESDVEREPTPWFCSQGRARLLTCPDDDVFDLRARGPRRQGGRVRHGCPCCSAQTHLAPSFYTEENRL